MRLRKILIGVGLMLSVLIGIGAFALSRLDPNDYVGLIDTKVREATGRELKIDGKVGYSLSLLPTLAIEGIRFQNAPWGSRADMVIAKRVEIRIALLPLVRGDVEVRGLTLIEPDLLLEVGPDGAKNWEFEPKQTKQSAGGTASGSRIQVHRTRIENGVITYREAKPKRDRRLALERVTITGANDDLELRATGSLNTVPVEIDASVHHGGRLGVAGTTGRARFGFGAPGLKLAGAGVVPIGAGTPEGLDIRFNADISDWTTLAKLTQGSAAALPALKAEGNARARAGKLLIEDLKATLGKSSATASVRIGLGDKTSGFEARLDSPFVDLSELQGAAKPGKPSSDGRVFSAEPFQLEAIRTLNGRADVRIAKLTLRDGKALDGLYAQATFRNGKVSADPIRILVEGRELRSRLNADASSGKALALDLALDGEGIPLGALAALLNVPGAPQGSATNLSIRFSGTGSSVRGLMAGASGDVRIVVGPGRLKNQAINFGADVSELLNAVNPARTADPYTELKCAVIRLGIRQGVAHAENGIAAETSKVNVIGGGVIDLRTEALDLGFRPKAVSGLGIGLGGLAAFGRLRGTLASPQVQIDASGAAMAATQLGLAAATGGLSMLAGALLTDSVPEHPCQAALSGNARARQAQPQPTSGVVDSVMGGIKRLFGR